MRLRGFWMRIKVEDFEPKKLKESIKIVKKLESKIIKKPKKSWLRAILAKFGF